MEGYTFILKNEKVRQYNFISWVFLLFNILAIVWVAINKGETGVTGLLLVFLPAMLVLFLHYHYVQDTASRKFNTVSYPWLIMLIPWIALGIYWVAAAILLFSWLHEVSTRVLRVQVRKDHLEYPSYPIKNFTWEELNNVVLKDGLLTIDLKNNRLIQQEIDDSRQPADEKEFNDFCNRQLNAAS